MTVVAQLQLSPAEGHPLDTRRNVLGAALLARQRQRATEAKGMSAPPVPVTPPPERHWLTVRISPKEKQWVTTQASLAGLSQSEYLRRQVFHGRPVLALTDEVMLRELRRLGGLLKSNFVTLRQGDVTLRSCKAWSRR